MGEAKRRKKLDPNYGKTKRSCDEVRMLAFQVEEKEWWIIRGNCKILSHAVIWLRKLKNTSPMSRELVEYTCLNECEPGKITYYQKEVYWRFFLESDAKEIILGLLSRGFDVTRFKTKEITKPVHGFTMQRDNLGYDDP